MNAIANLNAIPTVTVVTEYADTAGLHRNTYAGILVGNHHAFYVDPEYNVAVLERVTRCDTEYVTTGGCGSVILEVSEVSAQLIETVSQMSALELLAALIPTNGDDE